MEMDRILRMPELVRITGLSKASIYRQIAHGEFPQAVILGKNSRGWRASAVTEWLERLEPAETPGAERSKSGTGRTG